MHRIPLATHRIPADGVPSYSPPGQDSTRIRIHEVPIHRCITSYHMLPHATTSYSPNTTTEGPGSKGEYPHAPCAYICPPLTGGGYGIRPNTTTCSHVLSYSPCVPRCSEMQKTENTTIIPPYTTYMAPCTLHGYLLQGLCSTPQAAGKGICSPNTTC